jgi:hypothetical protein
VEPLFGVGEIKLIEGLSLVVEIIIVTESLSGVEIFPAVSLTQA